MKGVSALLSIYAIGTVLLGTNVSKIGTQEALTYTAKTMVVDSSAQLTALGVQKVGEICDLPVAITIILSFISGIVVSTKVDGIEIQWKNVSKKIDPPSGNVDKIKDVGIITEGSVGSIESGSKADTKPYTNSRPSFRKGVVEEVWENAKGPDGLVRDPNTGEVINWTPGESRKGVWDMGHIPEAKYSEMHEAYMNGELTTKEFVDWYNDPANYRPELPSNNRSHKYE